MAIIIIIIIIKYIVGNKEEVLLDIVAMSDMPLL